MRPAREGRRYVDEYLYGGRGCRRCGRLDCRIRLLHYGMDYYSAPHHVCRLHIRHCLGFSVFSSARSTPICPDDGWPVLSYRGSGFAEMFGKDAERSDEKNLRLWCEEAAKTSETGAYALGLRNSQYAREFIRANDGDPSSIQKIKEEY